MEMFKTNFIFYSNSTNTFPSSTCSPTLALIAFIYRKKNINNIFAFKFIINQLNRKN